MKILSWNIREAGRKDFKQQVRELIKNYNLDILFFMKTKVNSVRARVIIISTSYPNFPEVPPEGLSGELWVL